MGIEFLNFSTFCDTLRAKRTSPSRFFIKTAKSRSFRFSAVAARFSRRVKELLYIKLVKYVVCSKNLPGIYGDFSCDSVPVSQNKNRRKSLEIAVPGGEQLKWRRRCQICLPQRPDSREEMRPMVAAFSQPAGWTRSAQRLAKSRCRTSRRLKKQHQSGYLH